MSGKFDILLVNNNSINKTDFLTFTIQSDPAMKQFLLYLDEKNELGDKFVLEDLDETHLFINSMYVDRLKEKMDDLMEKLSYVPEK